MQNVDLSEAQDVACEKCNNLFFESAFAVKRVAAELSPTKQAGIIPIPVFICKECGHINEEFALTPERLRQSRLATPAQQR